MCWRCPESGFELYPAGLRHVDLPLNLNPEIWDQDGLNLFIGLNLRLNDFVDLCVAHRLGDGERRRRGLKWTVLKTQRLFLYPIGLDGAIPGGATRC